MRTIVVGFVLTALASSPAEAGSCDPVYQAGIKSVETPHHVFSTSKRGGKTTTSESVFADGVEYSQIDGRWRRSTMKAEQMLSAAKEKLTEQPDICTAAPDEVIGGKAVAVYQVHNSESGSESLVRILKSSGMLQGQTATLSSNWTIETRYDYTNITAPVVN